MEALVQAIADMLSDFSIVVRELELELLASDHLSICYVHNYMAKVFFILPPIPPSIPRCLPPSLYPSLIQYEQVLPTVLHIIDDMHMRNISGCKILELVHSGMQSGFPFVHQCLEKSVSAPDKQFHRYFYMTFE